MRMRSRGRVTLEVAEDLLKLTARITQAHGRHFILVDLNDSGGVTPEARRLILEKVRESPPSAIAFHGGDTIQRAMNMLLVNAIKLLGGRQNIAHFSTAAEAHAWLTAQRLKSPLS